jgi:hypothetical protein
MRFCQIGTTTAVRDTQPEGFENDFLKGMEKCAEM